MENIIQLCFIINRHSKIGNELNVVKIYVFKVYAIIVSLINMFYQNSNIKGTSILLKNIFQSYLLGLKKVFKGLVEKFKVLSS